MVTEEQDEAGSLQQSWQAENLNASVTAGNSELLWQHLAVKLNTCMLWQTEARS